MYSVLLVEDEISVRQMIRASIDWESFGFFVVGEAENGLEALDIIEEKNPDVVITDIKMPYMDGLSLISELRKTHPETTVIILSGYDEFSYAQTAIKLDVTYYALKPLSKEDFSQLLVKIKKYFDDKIESLINKKQLEEAYQNAVSNLKQQLLVKLYEGQTESILSTALSYDLPCDQDIYMTAVIEMEDGDEKLNLTTVNQVLLAFNAEEKKYFSTILEGTNIVTFYKKIKEERALEESSFIRKTLNNLNTIKKQIGFYIKSECIIGVSRPVYNFMELSESRSQAVCALNYRPYYPEYNIYYIGDLETRDLTLLSTQSMEQGMDKLVLEVKLGTSDSIGGAVEELISNKLGLTSAEISASLFKITTILASLALEYNIDIAKIEGAWSSLADILSGVTTIQNITIRLKKFCQSLNEEIEKKRKTSNKQFVEDAKKLIEQNYQDPNFSLEKISSMLCVSEAYFSSTFKKECEITFIGALTKTRMSHAKVLLKNTKMKNYEIALSVGFSDPNYFSFSFKKSEGISPQAYRKKLVNV
ncbi:MAG: response regulator [Spirochaetales bacterium]|nr:response regulator [Spirochaetales bacterium]